MTMTSSVPEGLYPKILELYAMGEDAMSVKQWLMDEHNITLGLRATQRLIKHIREERKELTQYVIKNEIKGYLTQDLATVDDMIESLTGAFYRRIEKEPLIANALARTICQYLDFRTVLCGMEGSTSDGRGYNMPTDTNKLIRELTSKIKSPN